MRQHYPGTPAIFKETPDRAYARPGREQKGRGMAVAFDEVRFPENIAYGAAGGPSYSTTVTLLQSGQEKRNINWSAARHRYEVAHAIKNQAQLDDLLAFFHARKGRGTGFRLKDWADYRAEGEILGEGDGETTVFQLVKSYTSGTQTTTRTIAKPVAGSVSIYVDDVLQSGGVSVDYATGAVTFDAAPAGEAVITADFEFDVPVRFDTDVMQTRLDETGLYSWGKIELVEVRV